MSLITKEQRDELYDLAMAAGLSDPKYRPELLDGIDPEAAGFIPDAGLRSLQLLVDLRWLAEHERIADGTVPLLVWLKNAAQLTRAFSQGASLRRWADRVSGLSGGEPVLTTERGADPDSPLVLGIGTSKIPLPEIKEAVLFEENEIIPFGFLEAGARVGKSVAHLSVPVYEEGAAAQTALGREVIFNGTGWAFGKCHIITNCHVVNARKQGASPASPADFLDQGSHTRIRFDFDDPNASGEQISSAAVVAWSEALDYALLKIPGGHHRPSLRRSSSHFSKTSQHIPVNIIQHPDGGPKMIAIRNNLVTKTTDDDVCYLTDTKFGSSGSPVFDDQWNVVALHRGSVIAEGIRYFGASTLYVNIGTQVSSIAEDIKKRFPAVWDDLCKDA